jgi:transposase
VANLSSQKKHPAIVSPTTTLYTLTPTTINSMPMPTTTTTTTHPPVLLFLFVASCTTSLVSVGNALNPFCTSPDCLHCTNFTTPYESELCFKNWLGNVVKEDVSQFLPMVCVANALKRHDIVYGCDSIIYGPADAKVYSTTTAPPLPPLPNMNTLSFAALKIRALHNFYQCKAACGGGCYSFAMASYIKEFPRLNVEMNSEQANQLCLDIVENSAESYGHRVVFNKYCYSGVGHGLMWVWQNQQNNNTTPFMSLSAGLAVCDGLPGGGFLTSASYYCRVGVYKQFWKNQVAIVRMDKKDISFKEIKPIMINTMINTCQNQVTLNGGACGDFWSHGVALETGGDHNAGGDLCISAWKQYKKLTPPDPDEYKTRTTCTNYVEDLYVAHQETYDIVPSYCSSEYCGVLCAPTTSPSPSTAPQKGNKSPSFQPIATTTTTSAAPTSPSSVGSSGNDRPNNVETLDTWQSVMIAAGVAGSAVMCVVVGCGGLWSWKLRHWAYGKLGEIVDDDEYGSESEGSEEGEDSAGRGDVYFDDPESGGGLPPGSGGMIEMRGSVVSSSDVIL